VLLLATTSVLLLALYFGIERRSLRLGALLLACLLVAVTVALVPQVVRVRYGAVVATFVTAAGILPLVMDGDGEGEASDPPVGEIAEPRVNVDYAAVLLARGPFTGDLPSPVTFASLKAEAPDLLGAVTQIALRFDLPRSLETGANAYLFLFPQREDGANYAAAAMEDLDTQYADFGSVQGDPGGFFLFGNGEVIAGASSEHVYCQASVYPDSNANVALANGIVSACVKYADNVLRVAIQPAG